VEKSHPQIPPVAMKMPLLLRKLISNFKNAMPDILDNIERFLKAQPSPVSAVEIAQRFLNITNAPAPIANRLVDTLLLPHPKFSKTDAGLWTVNRADAPAEKLSFFLCKLFPERTLNPQPFLIHVAQFAETDFEETITLSVAPDSLIAVSEKINSIIGKAPLLFDGFGNQQSQFNRLLAFTVVPDVERPLFNLKRIAAKLFPSSPIKSAADLSKLLGDIYHDENADAQFDALKRQAQRIIELLCERGIDNLMSLQEFIATDIDEICFDSYAFDPSFFHEMIQSPGVYIMRDKAGFVIYVGKAKNLQRRLFSYFTNVEQVENKLQKIRDELYDIEIIETGSELEALLKEYELIQLYDPPINRQYDVHPRPGYNKERYERILFLPSTEAEIVHLFLFNPAGRFRLMAVEREGINRKKIAQQLEYVFADIEPQHVPEIEIITSWVSRNADSVNSIDMRSIVSPDEALRLIELNVKNFDSEEQQIFR
jgi:hypothetical protein